MKRHIIAIVRYHDDHATIELQGPDTPQDRERIDYADNIDPIERAELYVDEPSNVITRRRGMMSQ